MTELDLIVTLALWAAFLTAICLIQQAQLDQLKRQDRLNSASIRVIGDRVVTLGSATMTASEGFTLTDPTQTEMM